MTWPSGTTAAVARSLGIYYRDAVRTARMDRLNAAFVSAGQLVFDIGAHVGDRTASFRRLGARVVTVEPQPPIHRALRLLFGRDEGVHLHQVAMGASPGTARFFVNAANPTTSTAARALVEAAPTAEAWADQVWDKEIEVEITTLDHLIARHGRPDFAKIDVEGFEAEVLRGLTQPLPALSVEFTTLQRAVAIDALEVLEGLDRYAYNYSFGEDHAMALERWVSASEMADLIAATPVEANSGDIYARLASRG